VVDELIDNSLCGYWFAGRRILAITREAKTQNSRVPVADAGNSDLGLGRWRQQCPLRRGLLGPGLRFPNEIEQDRRGSASYNSYLSGRNAQGAVGETKDTSRFMVHTAVYCSRCGGHLGLRYCMNGVAMNFKPATA
jgi:hypothetical protein